MKDTDPRPAVPLAFETTSLRIPITEILPLKELPQTAIRSIKYTQIAASIAELGLIAPPVVIRDREDSTVFHLLDGHIRVDVLKKLGQTEVVCLVATEDEAFTWRRSRSTR